MNCSSSFHSRYFSALSEDERVRYVHAPQHIELGAKRAELEARLATERKRAEEEAEARLYTEAAAQEADRLRQVGRCGNQAGNSWEFAVSLGAFAPAEAFRRNSYLPPFF